MGVLSNRQNRSGDTVHVGHGIVVPNADNAKTSRAEPSVTREIMAILTIVLASVELDYDARFQAYKIDDISSDCKLPAKA